MHQANYCNRFLSFEPNSEVLLTKLFEIKELVMEKIIQAKVKGCNDYSLPHKRKAK